jgi:hypothetical protein
MPVVIFTACLDLEQKFSFMDGHQAIFFAINVYKNKLMIINMNKGAFERRITMTLQNYYSDYHESFEYHGNTAVEINLTKNGVTIKRDWIFFDSVQEAQDFFYENCSDSQN